MGTPHAGSHVADAGRIKVLKAIAGATFMKAPENLTKALSAHSNELQDLSKSFERTTIFTQHLIEICTYYETKTTKFTGEEVVPRAMAALHYLNEREEGIAKEHRAMAKFRDANDDTYRSICQRLSSMGSEGMRRRSARQATYRVSQIPGGISRADLGQFLGDAGLGPVSNMRVHSLALCAGVAPTKTATITFTATPAILLQDRREWILQFMFKGTYGSLVIDTDFHGFTILNEVQPEDHCIDCIAIPGLGYHPFSVWQRDPEADPFMWLRDSLPQSVPGAQVLLYGYDPEFRDGNCPNSIEEIVLSFISDLRSTGRSSLSAKPVVFLAHSLGGIVLKQCLVDLANAGPSEMFMLGGVKACVFLAVPNCLPGSPKLTLMAGSRGFGGLLTELQASKNVDYLASLSGMLGGIAHANDIRLYSGYETVQTTVRNTGSYLLLQRVEAIQEGSEKADQFPIRKPHCSVPGLRAGSQTIDTIVGFVKNAVEATPAVETNTTAVAQHPTSRWRSFARNITSHLITSSSAISEILITPEDDADSAEVRHQFLSTLVAYGRNREKGIDNACPNTFDWVWTKPEIGLRGWLSDDNSLFWIRGKPGSGKSTLMRYIWDHQELSKALNAAPSDVPRIKAGFFFYYRGTHAQKSFDGLLHSILLRILEQEPRLLSLLIPEFVKLDPEQRKNWAWNLPRLMKTYHAILTQTLFSMKLFLFFDALDEYDGPPESIVNFVLSSVEKSSKGSTMLKLCLSSREWSTFEKRFSGGSGFKIHEHTDQDIRHYISTRLSNDTTLASRLVMGTEQEQLDVQQMEQSIASRANGVFIWVRAVIDEIHRGLSRGLPTTELLMYIQSFPDDLDEFYAEAIKRIPHQHRMEAFIMFELLNKVGETTSSHLMEMTLCAEFPRLADYVAALQAHRGDRSSADPDRWVKDRGAGLLEIVTPAGDYYAYGEVQFMHQTALDFASRLGFRALVLDDHFSLPLENGYSFFAKWVFSNIHDIVTEPWPNFPVDLLAQAELTTGKSMKSFIDSLDSRSMELALDSSLLGYVFVKLDEDTRDLIRKNIDQKLGFVVAQNLKIALHEYVEESGGILPDDKPFSLLHCISKQVPQKDEDIYFPPLFPISFPTDNLDLAPFLLQHGVRLNAVWDGRTPFQALFVSARYNKFDGSGRGFTEDLPLNRLVNHLLEGGQDPNVNITWTVRKGRRQSRTVKLITCKALHVATRDMAEKLLEHGADVNPIDSEGHTPLDLACGVGGNPFELGDHVQPHDVYPLASLLVRHGAKLTAEGEKLWPQFVGSIRVETQPLPKEFWKPGVISRLHPSYLGFATRKLKGMVKK